MIKSLPYRHVAQDCIFINLSLTHPDTCMHTHIHRCRHIHRNTYRHIHRERHTNTDTLIHTLLTEPAASWATWPVYSGVRARC